MTIKFLASIALAASVFTACSETTVTPPTKAQQCSAGLSSDCLLGTWSNNGPTIVNIVISDYGVDSTYIIDPSHNLSAAPATLKFYVDTKNANKFEYTFSSLSKDDCKAYGKMYGDWNIIGNSLRLYASKNNDCMDPTLQDITVVPEIKVEGSKVTLKIPQLFLLEPEMKQSDALVKASAYEIYTAQ
jgi:hypothetical protein